jgi:chromosomal replication initiation ATPase DnaA
LGRTVADIDAEFGPAIRPMVAAMVSGYHQLEARLAKIELRQAGVRNLAREGRIAAIVADAAALGGCSTDEILSPARHQELFRTRAAIAWAARETTGHSQLRIARALGRHHTSIMNQLRRAEALRESDPEFRWLADRLVEAAGRRAA